MGDLQRTGGERIGNGVPPGSKGGPVQAEVYLDRSLEERRLGLEQEVCPDHDAVLETGKRKLETERLGISRL
jgi:hypothetical protein